jgi:uncharacterized protein YwqG
MERKQAVDILHSSMPKQAALLAKFLLPSARIQVLDTRQPTTVAVASFFGGTPFLPSSLPWPTWDKRDYLSAKASKMESRFEANPRATGLRDIAARMRKDIPAGPTSLMFVGQLNLADFVVQIGLTGWPSHGVLSFFYDPGCEWGFDPMERGHCRVLFMSDVESLSRREPPNDGKCPPTFPEWPLTFRREWTLPGHAPKDWDYDEYIALKEQLLDSSCGDPIHRCGGYPEEVQNPMELQCQLVTNGLYCGDSSGYRDPRVKSLEAGACDWRLLLQIDSDERRFGWMWGDAGRVYFWNRHQDTEQAEFDGSWAILQCY